MTWSDEPPAGADGAARGVPAGFHGEDFLTRYRKARAELNAARRRRTGRRTAAAHNACRLALPPSSDEETGPD